MGQKSSILIARLAALSLLAACSAHIVPASAQSLTDKLKGLFGGGDSKPQEQQAPQANPDEPRATSDCPQVAIRAGASTFAVAAPGKQAIGNDVRYQITITKTARDCTRTGGDITAVHRGWVAHDIAIAAFVDAVLRRGGGIARVDSRGVHAGKLDLGRGGCRRLGHGCGGVGDLGAVKAGQSRCVREMSVRPARVAARG